MIDRATVDRIKDTADIVEVVGDYVHLIRRGANYMGLCPFHNERTPSFSVNKARNFCYCFSCHKGGSPITFIMEKEGISYYEALLHLAKKYGIKVEERELTDEEKEKLSLREGMFIANEWAMNYFHENLKEKEEGRNIGLDYLYQRGLTEEAINTFRLGYSIDKGSDFVNAATQKGFNADILKQVGLVGTSQTGQDYDRFRGRVIFPIFNSSGKTIAFGGRDLKGGPAKYINSPESEIYKKSLELFGMYQARSAITREDRCYLVEGYLDVISMWQSGIKNVVASSGTALTDGQINLIHRFTKNVTLIYDGDPAGIKASLRGIDMLLSHELDVKVLLLPDGDDPDSFSRKHTADEFKNYIKENETDLIRFKARILLSESADDPQKKVEALRSIITSLAHIPEKVKRDIYIQECSRIFNVSEQSIISSVARQRENVIAQEKLHRERTKLSYSIIKENEETEPVNSGSVEESNTSKRIIRESSSPLKPLEWNLLEYCLKYGFITLWDDETIEGDEKGILAINFIDEELKIDEITLSEENFKIIFEEIKNHVPSFKRSIKEYSKKLEQENELVREQRRNEIAEKGLSISDIKRLEEELENDLQTKFENSLKEFAKNYSIREFASHENPVIRHYANKAFRQTHQLSNIFRRDGNKVEEEEDRLLPLILNSLNVLKNGILDIRLEELMEKIRQLPVNANEEEHKELSNKISFLLEARKQMAKNMGERIISPAK